MRVAALATADAEGRGDRLAVLGDAGRLQPVAVQADAPAGLVIGADRQGAAGGGGFRPDPFLSGGGEGDEDGAGPQGGEG